MTIQFPLPLAQSKNETFPMYVFDEVRIDQLILLVMCKTSHAVLGNFWYEVSRIVTKPTKWHVRPAKTQT